MFYVCHFGHTTHTRWQHECSARTKWQQCRKRVFACWNMRGVHLLLQCGVHSETNAEKNRRVTRAFCGGIGSFRTLVVCVKGKARGDQACLMKQWREWGRGTHRTFVVCHMKTWWVYGPFRISIIIVCVIFLNIQRFETRWIFCSNPVFYDKNRTNFRDFLKNRLFEYSAK
jgi:hypothetical protein